MEYFKAEPESDVWKPYVEYVDEMLVAGFLKTIKRSVSFLMDNTDSKSNIDCLFEAHLELKVIHYLKFF